MHLGRRVQAIDRHGHGHFANQGNGLFIGIFQVHLELLRGGEFGHDAKLHPTQLIAQQARRGAHGQTGHDGDKTYCRFFHDDTSLL